MMRIIQTADITDKTTWHIPTTAAALCTFESPEDVIDFARQNILSHYPKFYVIGGGANSFFATKHYDGIVIEVAFKGKEKIKETESTESWKIMAGEDWIDLVTFCADNNLGGIENLALIPGRVGAAPIQNIAAYGRAFEEVCESVTYTDLRTGVTETLSVAECKFGYRTSIFKERIQNDAAALIIHDVVITLTKPGHHHFDMSYFSLSEKLSDTVSASTESKTIQDVYGAVIKIRESKLPDHKLIGTNGSTFVNPIVTGEKVLELKKKYPRLQHYPTVKMQYTQAQDPNAIDPAGQYKIAAGHIFDMLGWKGRRIGRAGTWEKHALVVCSFGATDPSEIETVIRAMQNDFFVATGIHLQPEINIVE